MPMTLDTYSVCSYNCQYCFSAYQREVRQGLRRDNYIKKRVVAVDPEEIKRIFTEPNYSQFWPYIEKRYVLQWGGLSDQFDEFERKLGITLDLLRFFREIEYPISFSTKAAWWVYDQRYRECFEGFPFFNVKFSIISLDEEKVRLVEKGCPSARQRLQAMAEAATFIGGGVTLRLRPFIIGMSNPSYLDLIKMAANCGASAVSTEFFCLEERARGSKTKRFPVISSVVGFDILEFYRRFSVGGGLLRLNRNVKRPFVDEMEKQCAEVGLRFYVSDAHFKERCANGSCCGLAPNWNYNRGQTTEALLLAKKNGEVRWADIAGELEYAKTFLWRKAQGYNQGTQELRNKYRHHTMFDYLRHLWNHPKLANSPCKMFGGILMPDRVDADGNIVYVFDETRA